MKTLEVDGLVWQEGRVFVSYCPELDLSSCGDTVEEARTNLRTAIRLFLEEARKMGTLEAILQESGFKETTKGWQGPRLMATGRSILSCSRTSKQETMKITYDEEGKIAGIEVLDASQRIAGIGRENFTVKVDLHRG